jgi:hypothetical protein
MVLWLEATERKGLVQNIPLQKYYSPSFKQHMKHVLMVIPGYVNQEISKLTVKLPQYKNYIFLYIMTTWLHCLFSQVNLFYFIY